MTAMLIVRALVLTAALACFVLAALPRPPVSKVNLVAAGLALWVSVVVWDAWAATDLS